LLEKAKISHHLLIQVVRRRLSAPYTNWL